LPLPAKLHHIAHQQATDDAHHACLKGYALTHGKRIVLLIQLNL